MPNPLLPVTGPVVGLGTGTMISESTLMTPKAIGLFYVEIAKACYVSTGSKRVDCVWYSSNTRSASGSFYRCLCYR